MAGAAALVLLLGVVLLSVSAGGTNGSYTVRAIFDDAGNMIPGENVKIGGVKVGTVESVTPTPLAKAAVVLDIDNPGFQDFRSDASCTIRPQGADRREVRRLPAHPAAGGRHAAAAAAEEDPRRPGRRGPVSAARHQHPQPGRPRPARGHQPPARTRALHDHPQRTRRRARGPRQRPQRGDPARQPGPAGTRQGAHDPGRREQGARQNSRSNSDKALAPFAARPRARRRIHRRRATRSPRRRRTARCAGPQPGTVPEVPRRARSGDGTARPASPNQTTPTFTDLGKAAPGINETFTSMPAFSSELGKFFKSLGQTAKVSGPALVATKPLLARLKSARQRGQAVRRATSPSCSRASATPAASSACSTSSSSARARPTATTRSATSCAPRASAPRVSPTRSNRRRPATANSATPAAPTPAIGEHRVGEQPEHPSLVMDRTLAVIKGATPAQAFAEYPGPTPTPAELEGGAPSAARSGARRHPSRSEARPRGPPTTRPPAKATKPAGCSSTTYSGTERDEMTPRPTSIRHLLIALRGRGAWRSRRRASPEPPAAPAGPRPRPRRRRPRPKRRLLPPLPQAPQTETAPAGSEAAAAPKVAQQLPQGATSGGPRVSHANRANNQAQAGAPTKNGGTGEGEGTGSAPRAERPAPLPSGLTPSLPSALQSSLTGVPEFLHRKLPIPPFLLPIFQADVTAYRILSAGARRDQRGRDRLRPRSQRLSAGAEGWMQFLPAEWAQYGVDANGDGVRDPYNPADAIFAAARYLRAAGGERTSGPRSTPTTTPRPTWPR